MAFCLFLFMIPTALSAGIPPQKHEVQELLNRLNKPAVKSIQSPDGDIIDCVHIQHQLVFDHPLLKNHTIQATTSFYPEGHSFDDIKSPSNAKHIAQLWHLNGRCPKGTIPVRRVKEEDILRASSVRSYGKKGHLNVSQLSSIRPESITTAPHEHAYVGVVGGKYYAAAAKFNTWKPQVGQNSFSLAQIWILAGDLETIEVGWQVNPDKYGDDQPRVFIYWTNDNYQSTGCYNLECSGFVQLSNEIALGGALDPVSTYGGQQYALDIVVQKRLDDGNWELKVKEHLVGYWPASLYTHLADSATTVQWGGEIVNPQINGQHTTTQMGSGHFPEEGPKKASFVSNLQVANTPNTLVGLPTDLQVVSEAPNCYGVRKGESNEWGTYFYYGGPGRNPKCP